MRLAARRHPCNGRRKRRASAPPRAAPCRRGAGGIVYYRMSSGRPDRPRNLFGVRQEDSSC
ncbi:citramalate synthase [Burkholderia pseudomallei]|uniref:Citramalate synthase n=4 Tax=pseudomallei group TaxID=111527 RepID=A0AAX1X6M7_BURML|nr:hypothetical protein BMA0169 [Burkholderia mallei ATCC 23344]ABN92136.1 conserved hypothetical protein [Burkholderia pseudomallei 1106a]AFR14539.1 hypothetical protein BPC006_I0651 [Burkholderia pseudomallei BPC006]ARK48502.1 citramalate synthase [Burkholderia pseudomallei]EBA49196.1 isopropylmalate/homocitrate/citramalate synthase [Burkholderia pseudomallei 305]EDU09377.1 conserved hypothetical protein [Burkholderia pseudomallei 1655]EEC37012.1 conserved hypothetical protein [Burkholderia